MEKEVFKCTECEFCKDLRSYGNTRGRFYCNHKNQAYIMNFFEKKRISKVTGFIGFGEKFSDKPNIKTSPAWCPKKAD